MTGRWAESFLKTEGNDVTIHHKKEYDPDNLLQTINSTREKATGFSPRVYVFNLKGKKNEKVAVRHFPREEGERLFGYLKEMVDYNHPVLENPIALLYGIHAPRSDIPEGEYQQEQLTRRSARLFRVAPDLLITIHHPEDRTPETVAVVTRWKGGQNFGAQLGQDLSVGLTKKLAKEAMLKIAILHAMGFLHGHLRPGNMVMINRDEKPRTVSLVDYTKLQKIEVNDINGRNQQLTGANRLASELSEACFRDANINSKKRQDEKQPAISALTDELMSLYQATYSSHKRKFLKMRKKLDQERMPMQAVENQGDAGLPNEPARGGWLKNLLGRWFR